MISVSIYDRIKDNAPFLVLITFVILICFRICVFVFNGRSKSASGLCEMQSKPKMRAKYPVIVHDTKVGIVHLKNIPASIKIPFYGVVGSVSFAKKLPSGDLYVECKSKAQQDKLLNTTDLAGIVVKCYEPTPTTDGVIHGLVNPHILKNHSKVVKYSLISNVITRVILATALLPDKIKVGNRIYKVEPYCPSIKRCTNCQILDHHYRNSCIAQTRCSKCGQGHGRERCTSEFSKCVNCHGNHSSAFRDCPKQQELRKAFILKSRQPQFLELLENSNEDYQDEHEYAYEFNDEGDAKLKNVSSGPDTSNDTTQNESTLSCITNNQESSSSDQFGPDLSMPSSSTSTYSTPLNETAMPAYDDQPRPSFLQFIITTFKPIMNISTNINIINQALDIYKSTYQIKDVKINESEKRDAYSILGLPINPLSCNEEPTINNKTSTSGNFSSNDNNSSFSHKISKPLKSLMSACLDSSKENLIIGDSVVRDLPRGDDISKTQVISVSGLNIDDCNMWLKNEPPQCHTKKVIFHVGINSCKNGKVSDKIDWMNLINNISRVFTNAKVMISSIVPSRGKNKFASIQSNNHMYEACKILEVEYIDNYHLFMVNGNPRVSLYADYVHLSSKGKAILSDKLLSYLNE